MGFADLSSRIELLRAQGGVVVLGIAGPPGAGKTTLAQQLVARLNREEPAGERQHFAYVPMDGFHLADTELSRQGLLGRKGAPETFDAHGYAALLQRLHGPRDSVIYAPGFDRTIEQPVAGAVPVYPTADTIITEGNYLLLDRPGWCEVRAQCTEVWYCEQPNKSLRIDRLIERHVAFGKTRDAAEEWVDLVDEPNARLIAGTRDRADLVVNPG